MRYLILFLFLLGCGGKEKETKIVEVPGPPTGNPPTGGNPDNPGDDGPVTWDKVIQPLMQQHCALSGCHAGAGFANSEQNFLRSNACRRVQNGTMPPRNSPRWDIWNDTIKQTIDGFCRENQ